MLLPVIIDFKKKRLRFAMKKEIFMELIYG